MEDCIDILVLGRSGQVAKSFVDAAELLPVRLTAVGRPSFDITQLAEVRASLNNAMPDIVINAAAYTAVDKAETDEEAAKLINAIAASKIAEATKEMNIPLIHISTDYVFDGRKKTPYVECDETSPQNVYGQTKLLGEKWVLQENPQSMIARTSWIYSKYGTNFVKTMLRLGQERSEISIVADQFGSPTSAFDLAYGLLCSAIKIVNEPQEEMFGIFHASGRGSATWFDFADYAFYFAQSNSFESPKIIPVNSEKFKTVARRPSNSRLLTSKFERVFKHRFPYWTSSLEGVVRDILLGDMEELNS
jgi:dTDP-4-dehydrorhamnose reductase